MPNVQVGDKAPDFSLPDESGRSVKLSSFRGRPVVLYFYPEDDTPLCTSQACGFRDEWSVFRELDAVVLGVSPDTVESHAAFKAKFGLPFALLADPQKKVLAKYGAWGEKTLYGNKIVGVIRSSFVIDAEGRVAAAFRNVRTPGHAERMAKEVRKLTRGVPG